MKTRFRALLLQAADELFSERGVEITLDDVARRAGVGVATAYRHFDSEQALVTELFQGRLAESQVEAAMGHWHRPRSRA